MENRKLSELRVVDLRGELEKRGLDKSGNKQVLVERLLKIMEEEGLDPDSYDFDNDKKGCKQGPDSSQDGNKHVKEGKPLDKEEPEANVEIKATKSEGNVENDSFIQLILAEDENLHDEEVDPNNSSAANTDTTKEQKVEGEAPGDTKEQMAKVVPAENGSTKMKSSIGIRSKMLQTRNLWITNITKATRAAELKQLLSAHGKVIGAKVVINAKHPGTCCYGYVTMESVKDADNCIAKLNNTELSGKIIRIEKERPEYPNMEKLKSKLHNSKNKPTDKDIQIEDKVNEADMKDKNEEVMEVQSEDAASKQPDSTSRKSRSHDLSRQGSVSKSLKKDFSILTYEQIKEKQERQRYHKRMLKEENRRRREEAARRREIDKMEHAKIARIEREREKLHDEKEKIRSDKEKLRYEKEKLDREKDRIIKLERDIHLEKLELEREKARLQEERRALKRSAEFRRNESFEDRKRNTNERHFQDGSTQMRFESHGRYNEHNHGHEHEAIFVPMREERTRRPMPEIKDDPRTAARFIDSSQESQRFERSAANNNWSHPKSIPARTFGSDTWRPPTPHRWNPTNMSHVASSQSSTGSFQAISTPNVGPPCPPPPVINNYGANRFEYKSSNAMRKY